MLNRYLIYIAIIPMLISCSASYEEKLLGSKELATYDLCNKQENMSLTRNNLENTMAFRNNPTDLDCTNFSEQALENNDQASTGINKSKKIKRIQEDIKRIDEIKKKRMGYLSKNIIIKGEKNLEGRSCFYDVLGKQETLTVCIKCSCPSTHEF